MFSCNIIDKGIDIMNDIVGNFREKTDMLFHKLDGYSAREIEEIIGEEIQKILREKEGACNKS